MWDGGDNIVMEAWKKGSMCAAKRKKEQEKSG